MFDVPILFAVYNRRDTAEKVLEAISAAKPARLYIASNAPNPLKHGDHEKVDAVRSMIDSKINWPCKIERLYRTEHLSAGPSLSSSMLWFFETVGEGIVFEDDTLPAPDFFPFCKSLLERYRYDDSVRMIGGNNFQNGKIWGDGSYYFSNITHSWGYASWRRAWQDFDYELVKIDDALFEQLLIRKFEKKDEKDFWRNVYHKFREGRFSTWDFQFLFTMWLNDAKCIVPNKNLVTNIGFGNNATHTLDADDTRSNLRLGQITKIIHPSTQQVSTEADRYYFKKHLSSGNVWGQRVKRLLSRLKLTR